jgi:aminopeptidase N
MGGVYLAGAVLGALMLVAGVWAVLVRRQAGMRPWSALWLLAPAVALIVCGTLLLTRERRHTEAAQHVARAKDLTGKGLTERAERELERALELKPKDAEAEKALQEIEQQREEERTKAERRRTQPIPTGGGGGGPGLAPESRDLPRSGIDIHDYHLAATLQPDLHQLKATATLSLRPRDPNARDITLLLSPSLITTSVKIDGKTAPFKRDQDRLTIQLPESLPSDRPIKATIAYDGFGHDAVIPGGDRIADDGCYLRPESEWYPATHLFDFSTPLTLAVTVPAEMTVIGPGELKQHTKSGDTATFVWRCDLPIRAIVMAAARYEQRQRKWRGVEVSVCTFPQHADRAARYFHSIIDILDYFGQQFGPYPFTKFALVEIPYFPGGYGAPSFVMCYDKVVERGDVDEGFIAHEIAHQWWGHAVGVDGPGAGWLCEGFAEYSSCMYEGHAHGADALRLRLEAARERYVSSLAGGPEEAIVETDPFNQGPTYAGVVYQKGAYVLHMLRTVLGEELFSRCMTDYALACRGRNATLPDFENACTRTAGTSLDWFFDQWVYQPGAIRLTYDYVTRRIAGGKHLLRVAIQQETDEPYRMPLDIAIKTSDGALRQREMLDGAKAEYEYRLESEPLAVTLDPDCNLLMHTPSKVRIDGLR